MDIFIVFSLVLAFVVWAFVYVLTSILSFRRGARLPQGPYPFPVIGNILQLGQKPNQSLARLAKTYGPLMSLKLGSKTTIVVSSPTVAREVLQKNDLLFSSRTIPTAAHAHDHHKFSMVWLPTSDPWRNLRKISKEQMFAAQRLDASQGLRQEKVKGLCDYLHRCSARDQAVNIGDAAFTTSLNLISTTLFSVDFSSYDSNSSQELKEIVWGIMEKLGAPNLADYFPVLQSMDLQGISHQAKSLFGKLFDIFDDIINERQRIRGSSNTSSKKNDFLEALLDHNAKNESEFSRNIIKHLLLDFFVAGTDTTSATVEWAMAELLRSPEKMARARGELHQVIGTKETIRESDISRLPYLEAIVKETFRLHPAAPLLGPHKADAEVEISGYLVPKNAQILVNLWASARDSETWADPETFSPERFLHSEIDAKGQHFELIPFGAGRRMCPGLPLANRMVHLMMVALIHNFDWKLEDGMKPEEIDMEEKFGVTVQKAVPLHAIPVKH